MLITLLRLLSGCGRSDTNEVVLDPAAFRFFSTKLLWVRNSLSSQLTITFFDELHQYLPDHIDPLDGRAHVFGSEFHFLLPALLDKKSELRFVFLADNPELVALEVPAILHVLAVQGLGVDDASLEEKNFSSKTSTQLPVVDVELVHFLELSLTQNVDLERQPSNVNLVLRFIVSVAFTSKQFRMSLMLIASFNVSKSRWICFSAMQHAAIVCFVFSKSFDKSLIISFKSS